MDRRASSAVSDASCWPFVPSASERCRTWVLVPSQSHVVATATPMASPRLRTKLNGPDA